MIINKSLKDNTTKLEVAKLYSAGLNSEDISRKTGIPARTLRRFLSGESYQEWWAYNTNLLHIAKNGPNILLIDIETSPILGYVWGLWDQNVSLNQIVEDWEILVVRAKWLGSGDIIQLSSGYEYLNEKDQKKVKKETGIEILDFNGLALRLHELLDQSDVIVAQNGARFDNKKIKAKLVTSGLTPPSPYKVIDTLKICRDQFAFTSNKKQYLSKIFGGDGKLDTGGMQLWIDCLNGCSDAWIHMINYCGVDVEELERIYLSIRAWDNKHPNLQVFYQDALERCGNCGSPSLELVEGKFASTNTSRYEVVRCNDCGATKRRRKNIRSKEQMKNTLMNIS